MGHFLSKLQMEAADDTDTGRWILTDALVYSSDLASGLIVVPKGFVTDLASTPRLPVVYLLAGNVAAKAAVLHDWNYSSGQFSRKVCDAMFREACAATGVAGWRSWILWAGVRIGGGSHYTAATPA